MFRNSINRSLLICLFLSMATCTFSQKVSDILENGIVVKNKYSVILRFENGKFKYDLAEKPSDNFDPYKNNSYFLLKNRGSNIYLSPPLNPLNYSTNSEITFTPDEINKSFSDALGSIISSIAKLTPGSVSGGNIPPIPKPSTQKKGKNDTPVIVKIILDSTCIKKILTCKNSLDEIATLLKANKTKDLTAVFKSLQALDFIDKVVVDSGMASANRNYANIVDYYNKISLAIERTKSEIKDFAECTPAEKESFIHAYVMNSILKDEINVLEEYSKYLKNTKNVIDLVNSTVSKSDGLGKNWFISFPRFSLEDDKVGNASITIYEDGYTLSDEGAIIRKNKKQLESINLKFRKFQRFIPEVSAGIAYTKLSFTKYDLEPDLNTGKKHIISAGEDKIRNLNFTTMINFNYYTPHSIVHPFWQLGLGANAGYPTLLTGLGGRINAPSLKRIAVSIGLAGTWVKTLTSLKLGDEVPDASALEKDLKYEFSIPLKPYFGIQINF